MARLPRFVLPGQPQHVIQRGNNRTPIFRSECDYSTFRDYLAIAIRTRACVIHAYVFMTNHVHLLMTPATKAGISKAMQSVGRRYVQYFNLLYGRTGTLWEGRYRATLVDSDRYLLSCYRYIELNPVRSGQVARPEDYRWSSYRANAYGEHDSLVTPHARYTALGAGTDNRQTAYRALFRTALDEHTLAYIRECTNNAWALGSDRFRGDVTKVLNRRAHPLSKGGDWRSKGV